MQAPINVGSLVRAKEYVSGGPVKSCGKEQDSFWGDDAKSYNCGFAVDPRRVDKYGGCHGCSPQSCACGGGCGVNRNIDDAFDDLCVSRPLDYLYMDQAVDSGMPLQQTKFSHGYGLRCGIPPASAASSSGGDNCDLYKSSQKNALRPTVRSLLGP